MTHHTKLHSGQARRGRELSKFKKQCQVQTFPSTPSLIFEVDGERAFQLLWKAEGEDFLPSLFAPLHPPNECSKSKIAQHTSSYGAYDKVKLLR